jgi:hypothetical protein
VKYLFGFWPVREPEDYLSTTDLMKLQAVLHGLDPSFIDEIENLPSEPGSLGLGDPGKLATLDVSR